MRLPLMMVLIDASSTAASHDPGATLRRLRPPYHAVRLGETDRGYFQLMLTVFGYRFTSASRKCDGVIGGVCPLKTQSRKPITTRSARLVEQTAHALFRVRIPVRLS